MSDRGESARGRSAALLVACGARRCRRARPTRTSCSSGWSSRSARSSRTSSRCRAPKKFNPQPYAALGAVEPFSTQKLTVALKQEARQPNSLLAAEINRRKEPLEAYPVDSMAMVGSVNRNGQPYALLKVDNLLYQVKQGDYLGQNYGKIIKISETDVAYREIVQDAAGEWIERNSALQLQEKAR